MCCYFSRCLSARVDWLRLPSRSSPRRRRRVFFFNDTATTEIYTLSLHDALPISPEASRPVRGIPRHGGGRGVRVRRDRSEEHTSELQSLAYLVCRLLLEKKKQFMNCDSNVHFLFFFWLLGCSNVAFELVVLGTEY